MKVGTTTEVTLSQPGFPYELRTRFEETAPGAFFFDVGIVETAAKGARTPFFVQVCTPVARGLPATHKYEVSVSQGGRDLLTHVASSGGNRASLKINTYVDSRQPVKVKVRCPASKKLAGKPHEPPLWVYLKARHVQGAQKIETD